MHRKKIIGEIQKHGLGISHTVSVSAFFDAGDIHAFRTHVKKLRAFLHWVGKGKKDLPPSFKEVYRVSGQLRDIQVLLKAMEEKVEVDPGFTDWLQESEARLQRLWDDRYDSRIIKNLRRRLQHPELKKPTPRRLRSFYDKGVGKIEAIVFLPSPADDDLHNIRKELKDMYYVYIWGKKNNCTHANDETPELLNRLGEQCGQFNDRRRALELLNAYLQLEQEEDAKRTATALKQHWEQDKQARRVGLLEDLRKFILSPNPPYTP